MSRLSAVLIICSVVGLSGCTDGPLPLRNLDAAAARWQSLKADNGDDYRFVVNASSVFGPGYETTFTVQNDKIVKRSLVVTDINNEGNTTPAESWSETEGTLGSHDEGAELRTVDERYAACRAELEATNTARSDIDITYIAPANAETTQHSVLASCFILPKGTVYDGGAEVVTSLEFLRNPEKQAELDKSLETWQNLKAENGQHYRYEVSAGSVFGPGYSTTLTIQADRVVQRDLAITQIDNEGNTTVVERWSETGDALGTHDDGAELITVDERYKRCKDDVVGQNPVTNDIYLEFQDNGVLRDCSYVSKGTAYDGGNPVIVSLEFLSTKQD